MRNLICNKWTDSSNEEVIEIINPANKKFIDSIPN